MTKYKSFIFFCLKEFNFSHTMVLQISRFSYFFTLFVFFLAKKNSCKQCKTRKITLRLTDCFRSDTSFSLARKINCSEVRHAIKTSPIIRGWIFNHRLIGNMSSVHLSSLSARRRRRMSPNFRGMAD